MLTRQSLWLLVVLVVPAWAALVRGADFDKYLLDDTDFVITVNVKQILANPQAKKQIADLFEKVQKLGAEARGQVKFFSDLGIDPVTTLDRITLVMGKSSHRWEPNKQGGRDETDGPLVICEGRFDAAKFRAAAAAPAPLKKDAMSIKEMEGGKYYRITLGTHSGPYVALIDPHTVLMVGFKDQMVDSLAKAAGTKKTVLKHKAMADLLDRLDPKQSVAGGAIGAMISGSEYRSNNGNTSVTHHTLAEQGIQSASGSIKIGNKIAGSLALKTKDVATAQRIAATMQQGLDEGIKEGTKEIEKHKEMAPLLDVMKSIRIVAKDNGITLTGEGGLDALGASAFGWFGFATVRTEPVAVPAPGK